MRILKYDEATNVKTLARLPLPFRTAFALLCAARILPCYARFHARTGRGSPDTLFGLSERLWRDVGGDEMAEAEIRVGVDRVTELVPDEDEGWDEATQPYAEDAAATLAYAFRARLTGDPQEAAWAGRRTYEAADHFLQAMTGGTVDTASAEAAILSHPIVQSELARQRRDLDELIEIAEASDDRSRLLGMRKRSEEEAAAFFLP